MNIEIKDWRQLPNSDLNKAKKLVKDKNTNLKELSKLTSIPYQTLVNYRYDIGKLDNAIGVRINRLSQVYDALKKGSNRL